VTFLVMNLEQLLRQFFVVLLAVVCSQGLTSLNRWLRQWRDPQSWLIAA
jgi:hypothetical protein